MLLVDVPAINGLGKTNGCEKAYNDILKNLSAIYTNEDEKEIKFIKDKIKVDKLDLESTNNEIIKKAKKILNNNYPIFIGGDHSITYPLFKAFSELHKDSCLIVFDAHVDCMHNFHPPTHEDWLRVLIEEGFNPKNLILIGVRNMHSTETKFLDIHKPNLFSCKQLFDNLEQECDTVMEIARTFGSIYMSIDIDVLDAAFVPGTAYGESAGLTPRELVYLLQRIKLLGIKAADIVEINPDKDKNGITSKAAAKIIAELL